MNPLQTYYRNIQEKTLQPDPAQESAIRALQQLYENLTRKKWTFSKQKFAKGLYLWGESGRGKTYLMDLFYNHLPLPKLRLHFYQFMHEIHRRLAQWQGHANPLNRIVTDLTQKAKVICLDELLVHDIADAMLLSQLLQTLLQSQITLIITSNTAPWALYEKGLQRDLFLPAIAQIQKHLTIFHLISAKDYRIANTSEKNALFKKQLTLPPFVAHCLMNKLRTNNVVCYQPLSIYQRLIAHKGYTNDTIEFAFDSICAPPRSQNDYLALAKRFSHVFISNIKPIDEHNDNCAHLFMQLVDVLYDADVTLILMSETDITDLYPKGRFFSGFKRTTSRLLAFQQRAWTSFSELRCARSE
jgi:cell division protein ZapE